jgi:hypothetical protein
LPRRKASAQRLGHRLKKIEEVDKTQEDADGTLTDEGEVEEIQDFVEGDSQCFCTKRISCTVKAVIQSMASSSAQKHKAQPSVLTRSTPLPLSRHPELTLLPIALSQNTATFDQTCEFVRRLPDQVNSIFPEFDRSALEATQDRKKENDPSS